MLKKIFLISDFISICFAGEDDIIFVDGFEVPVCNPLLECCQGNVLFQENFNSANQN